MALALGLVYEVLLVRGEQALAVGTLHQLLPAALWLPGGAGQVGFPVPVSGKLCTDRKSSRLLILLLRSLKIKEISRKTECIYIYNAL